MTVGLLSFVAPPPGFPGQVGNPVGFAATPAIAPASFAAVNGGTWPGAFTSLTAYPGGAGAKTISNGTNATSGAGTSGNPWVFAGYDIDGGTSGTTISVSNAIFVGTRIQSNQVNNFNIKVTGSNVSFIYCSVTPRASLWTSPPGGAWPSSGAGTQTVPGSGGYTNTGTFSTPSTDGYQYGAQLDAATGPVNFDHCDMWGFGNAITFLGTSVQFNITNNWIHDSANANVTPPGAGSNYHIDGPGYLNGGTPPSNILLQGNTVATIGNTNIIAFQAATSGYTNISIIGNFFAGDNAMLALGTRITAGQNTNWTVTDNVIGTDLSWQNAIVDDAAGPFPSAAMFTLTNGWNNLWRRNKFKVLSGTTHFTGSTPSWTGTNDGNFLLPDNTLSASDWTN